MKIDKQALILTIGIILFFLIVGYIKYLELKKIGVTSINLI